MPALNQIHFDIHLGSRSLNLVRQRLDTLDIHDPKVARLLCKIIPAQCPFEHDIELFSHVVIHIPPMPFQPSLRANNWSSLSVSILSGGSMW